MKNRKKIEDILLTDYGFFDDFTVNKLLDLFNVSKSFPDYDEIYRNAQYMDEKEFEDWLYKQQ